MYGIYLSASGAQAFNDQMEVLSNNIANADTPGFKREFAILTARPAEAMIEGTDIHGSGTTNNVGGGVNLTETKTDFGPGAFKQTGIATDVALTGEARDAFFVVARDREQFLTRAGNFSIDRYGYLQTQDGLKVISADGVPVHVNPDFPIQVTDTGRVIQPQAGTSIPLAIERPRSLDALTKVGTTLFSSPTPTTPVSARERIVKQGVLEHSGTNPVQEMMQLIQVSRGFEANIRMIQNQDSTTSALIDRVLGQA